LPQSAITAIIWYLRPRFHTSASIWTKSILSIVNHFWPLSNLHGILIAIWSNLTETAKIGQNCKCRYKYDQNLSYLGTRTYVRHLYATLGQIWSTLPQNAMPAISWYLTPRLLTSASIWTKSFILHILDQTWSLLTKWGHTGPLKAVLHNVCHSLASEDIRSQFRLNSSKLSRMSCAASNVAINVHTSLQQDIWYHCGPVYNYLASWSQCDHTCPKASKLDKIGNASTNMTRIYQISTPEHILYHYMQL